MLLPASILTPEAAAEYIDQAAVLAGIPRDAWDQAADPAKQAALDAAWLTISAQPGYEFDLFTNDKPVRLATALEALVRIDLQTDPGAAARSRLTAQGVESVSLGSVREGLGKRPTLHPQTVALLGPYRGSVRMR